MNTDTQQKILLRVVDEWLRDGVITKDTQAWGRMQDLTGVSRTTWRQVAEGKRAITSPRTVQALAKITGEDVPTLAAAARRWRPKKGSPQWQAMELERMRARVEELEEELAEVKAQAEALPVVLEAADVPRKTLLDQLQEQGDKDTAEIVAELMPPRGRRAR